MESHEIERRLRVYDDQPAGRCDLYTGVTADLAQRVVLHRQGKGSAYCRKYNLVRLVMVEPYPAILEAIAREKAIKEWKREWKVELIERMNPGWDDLFDRINQ